MKKTKRWIGCCLLILAFYGGIRLYFWVTDGFCLGNMVATFPNNPQWDTRALSKNEEMFIQKILSQKFSYLGKGCQSYVFLSEDGQHVIKFFKYQRFRPKPYLLWFSFIPAVDHLIEEKMKKKTKKLYKVFESWKIAFDHLQEETGLVYVHLNATDSLHKTITIRDKIGITHQIEMDRLQFLIQKKTVMLCPTIDALMEKKSVDKAKQLLQQLLAMVLSEYHRGFADNDHALMQNTGVFCEQPIHVDVGQFVKNEAVSDPLVYHQELFNKTYKFRLWLHEKYPELRNFLDQELLQEMGEKFFSMEHKPQQR